MMIKYYLGEKNMREYEVERYGWCFVMRMVGDIVIYIYIYIIN